MACVGADGTLAPVAELVLRRVALLGSVGVDKIARAANVPLYRARASVRELTEAGLLAGSGDGFHLTDLGRRTLLLAGPE